MDQRLHYLCAAYNALLQISPVDPWRINNQAIYAQLRDDIAEKAEMSPEYVQCSFDGVANIMNRIY